MLILAAALIQSQAAARVGFQGFELGQTFAEARLVTVKPDKYGPKRLICVGDPDAPWTLIVTPEFRKAGIVRCGLHQTIGGSVTSASVEISESRSVGIDLYFFDGRLYDITLFGDFLDEDLLVSGLTRKFGSPTQTKVDSTQTKAGVILPRTTTSWTLKTGNIEVVAPDMSVKRLTVRYSDPAVEAKALAKIESTTQADM